MSNTLNPSKKYQYFFGYYLPINTDWHDQFDKYKETNNIRSLNTYTRTESDQIIINFLNSIGFKNLEKPTKDQIKKYDFARHFFLKNTK